MSTTEKQIRLQDRMTLGRKVGIFIDYLKNGGELEVNNQTFVWLDNHITHTETEAEGNEGHFGIDGLAIKCVRIDDNGIKSNHYIGQSDMPLLVVLDIIGEIKEIDWLGMGTSAAMPGEEIELTLTEDFL